MAPAPSLETTPAPTTPTASPTTPITSIIAEGRPTVSVISTIWAIAIARPVIDTIVVRRISIAIAGVGGASLEN
jgi:hypothetical protein